MSRLECKEQSGRSFRAQNSIRICPDWNVKAEKCLLKSTLDTIRICPDWNVKETRKTVQSLIKIIRICPDWNVKEACMH